MKNKNQTTFKGTILVALSGGADSVALLVALCALRSKTLRICAAHVNHSLRGEDALHDEHFCKELCAALNVPYHAITVDVHDYAQKHKLSTEAAARILRYRALEDARTFFHAAVIATGHHQDDVAETILMNLCRGSALKGLSGIPQRNGHIIRPVLEVSRAEIEDFLQQYQIPHVHDATNHQNDYTRNAIRNIILPAIKAHINPGASKVIARNAAYIKEDETYLQQETIKAFEHCCVRQGTSTHHEQLITLDARQLDELNTALSRRVIRHAISRIHHDHLQNIHAVHIDDILKLTQGSSGKTLFFQNLIIKKEYHFLHIEAHQDKHIQGGFAYTLNINEPRYIAPRHETVLLSSTPPDKMMPPNEKTPDLVYTKAFDYGNLTDELLQYRSRLTSDTIVFSNKGKFFTKKLQDFFTNEKIPRSERDHIALLAHQHDIVLIPGYDRINANYEWKNDEHHKKNTAWLTLWRKEGEHARH